MEWGDFGKSTMSFIVGFGTRWGCDRFVVSPKGKEKERERQQNLRTLLKENFEKNVAILEEIERDLTGRGRSGARKVPTYNVDLPILESTAGLVQFELFKSVSIYNIVNKTRYDLNTVSRSLNWLAEMYFRRPRELPAPTTPHSSVTEDNVFYDLARSPLTSVQNCQAACRDAIKALERYEKDNPPKRRRLSIIV
jgi:hypothetical protein